MASGHVNRRTGRTHGCTDQQSNVKVLPCQPGAVHTRRGTSRPLRGAGERAFCVGADLGFVTEKG